MSDLIMSGNVAYMVGHNAGVIMQDAPPAALPTNGTIANLTNASDTIKVANWGDDNNFPGMIRDLLAKDAEMKELINWCVKAAYGKGLVCQNIIDWDKDGKPIYEGIKDWNIIRWYQTPQVRKYLLEGFIDLFTYFNVFPEVIPTRDRSDIYSVEIKEAMDCRWAQMGEDGKLKTLIFNKNWPSAKLDDPKQTTYIPAIDPYDYDLVNKVKADKKLTKFIYPLNYPTIGATYYQVAHWDGLRVSGWLDIAAKIPEFKTALLKNQMTIKYLIKIPNTYWPSVYKNWNTLSEKQQSEKKKEKIEEINKSLTDVKNTGKSILNEVGVDPVTKEKIPGWEIDVIDDKTKAGAFLEDSQEASGHKGRALGLDPTLVGNLITGKGMGAGSGSDKQLAWNIYLALIDPYRQIMLDPLNFRAEFNGTLDKYPGFKLNFRDSIMETVNGHNQQVKETVA